MAFLIDCTLKGYEVRGVTTGTSKKGNVFKSIRVESQDGRNAEISCTNESLFASVDTLKKTNVCNFDVRAVSGREYSYITLLREPVVVVSDGVDY